jgi:tetratricopeptide (TPR) repeat protein
MQYSKSKRVWEILTDTEARAGGSKFAAMDHRSTIMPHLNENSKRKSNMAVDLHDGEVGSGSPGLSGARRTEIPVSNRKRVSGGAPQHSTARPEQQWENRFIQLMLLYGAGDVDSCRHNASNERLLKDVRSSLDQQISKERDKKSEGQGQRKEGRADRAALHQYVNLNLLLVKCHLIKKDEHKYGESVEILKEVRYRLQETIGNEVKEIKQNLVKLYIDRGENDETGKNEQSRSESHTAGGKGKSKRANSLNDLRWLLSAYGLIAAFFQALGRPRECEETYCMYVKIVEELYEPNSVEASNAYFMVGVYYFETEQLQKSLACFLKALYIRKTDHGDASQAAGEVHYNLAIVYKKLGHRDKAIEHFREALDFKRRHVGPSTFQTSDVLEVLGKYYVELGDLTPAYDCLQECYIIRKRLARTKREKLLVQRVAILLVYLQRSLEEELDRAAGHNFKTTEGQYRILQASDDVKSILTEEVKGRSIIEGTPELARISSEIEQMRIADFEAPAEQPPVVKSRQQLPIDRHSGGQYDSAALRDDMDWVDGLAHEAQSSAPRIREQPAAERQAV